MQLPRRSTRRRVDGEATARSKGAAGAAVTWWADDSAVTRHVRVRCCTCGVDVTTTGDSLSTRWIRAMVLLLTRRGALNFASVDVRLSIGRGCDSLVARRAVMKLVVSGRWMRLSRSSVQLPCLASGPCDGTALPSTSLARHCRGQRLSVRRSSMVAQACRQQARPTTHVRCLSTSCCCSYQSTLTLLSCRRCLTRSR